MKNFDFRKQGRRAGAEFELLEHLSRSSEAKDHNKMKHGQIHCHLRCKLVGRGRDKIKAIHGFGQEQ